MPPKGSKAKVFKCPYCGEETTYLLRHIRKYHPEKDDLEQIILDVYDKKERDVCQNPACGKLITHWRLDCHPRFCSSKCQNEYYRLTGDMEGNLIRISKKDYGISAAIYLIDCPDLNACKVGVSRYPEGRRAVIYKDIGKELFPIVEKWSTLYQCSIWEHMISHKYHDKNVYLGNLGKFAGSSEWYSRDILENLKREIESL